MNALRRTVVIAWVVASLGGCALGPGVPDDDSRVAAVGRIVDLDQSHGYAIVEFPTGRMFVTMDKRDMGKFIVGDELRIDSYGRPLPPRPRPVRGRPS